MVWEKLRHSFLNPQLSGLHDSGKNIQGAAQRMQSCLCVLSMAYKRTLLPQILKHQRK